VQKRSTVYGHRVCKEVFDDGPLPRRTYLRRCAEEAKATELSKKPVRPVMVALYCVELTLDEVQKRSIATELANKPVRPVTLLKKPSVTQDQNTRVMENSIIHVERSEKSVNTRD
jgi:hypothetical protein